MLSKKTVLPTHLSLGLEGCRDRFHISFECAGIYLTLEQPEDVHEGHGPPHGLQLNRVPYVADLIRIAAMRRALSDHPSLRHDEYTKRSFFVDPENENRESWIEKERAPSTKARR